MSTRRPSGAHSSSARPPARRQEPGPTRQGPVVDPQATPQAGPGLTTPANILALQRAVGNRAVGRLLASRKAAGAVVPLLRTRPGPVIQRKETHYFINNSKASIRSEPDMKPTGDKIPSERIVSITETTKHKGKEYVRTTEVLPEGFIGPPQSWDWTLKSNLTALDEARRFTLSEENIEGTSMSTRSFAAEVLKKAGVTDPNTWFANFKYTTFLGRIVSPPIHDELVQHLKDVEQKLVAKHAGDVKDPYQVGTALGMHPSGEGIKGSRSKATSAPRSMHFFGLAIDIEYTRNPYITEKKEDKEATAAVLPRAGLLVHGEKMTFKSQAEANVDEVLKLDKMLETYFSYRDGAKTEALQARLDAAKDKGAAPWNKMDVDKARKQIEQDLTKVAGAWGRSKKIIAEGGFTNLSKELIEAMDLHWGAAYGDLMHFDMRNKGTGAKIDQWRTKV
jgi:hypothetical protein